MAEDSSWLLSDEFVDFSDKIKEVHDKKKIKMAELKSFYEKIQAEIKVLEDQAKKIDEDFQNWKNSKTVS